MPPVSVNQALHDAAVERLKEASLACAHAEAGLSAVPLTSLEIEMLIRMFIVDDEYPTTNPNSALSQAACVWPGRGLDDWTSIFETIYRHPAWVEYRLRRDLLAAAQALERATGGA